MLSVFLPEAPFEHRSVSFRTGLMGYRAGICCTAGCVSRSANRCQQPRAGVHNLPVGTVEPKNHRLQVR